MNRPGHRLRVCAVLFACCGVLVAEVHPNNPLKAVRLNQEFRLRAGQRATLKGTDLRIKFLAVKNDSRCPSDVKCVWAGNAEVQLQISNGRRSKTLTLNTNSSSSLVGAVEYQGYKVKLVDLSPSPRSDRKIRPRDYSATFLVTKD